jgi:hypothetical protein
LALTAGEPQRDDIVPKLALVPPSELRAALNRLTTLIDKIKVLGTRSHAQLLAHSLTALLSLCGRARAGERGAERRAQRPRAGSA